MNLFQHVKHFKKGQLKIQQMAFVLVATMIFFAIVAIFYVSIKSSSIRENVSDLREDEIIEVVRKISGSPEFLWNFEDCNSCIDFDKVLMLKERDSYKNYWGGISLLQISRVYPRFDTEECELKTYPECNRLTLVEEENIQAHEAFVSLCWYDGVLEQNKCELGKVIMGFEAVG
tara:strand:+ start:1438 stop:1959 length:522 start_codon:yes stop_codon:yes gene_type:complete